MPAKQTRMKRNARPSTGFLVGSLVRAPMPPRPGTHTLFHLMLPREGIRGSILPSLSVVAAAAVYGAGMACLAGAIGWLRQRHHRTELAVRRGIEEKAALAEIGRIVNSSTDMTEVYRRFADAVRRLVEWDRIALSTVDEQTDELTLVYVEGMSVPGWEVGTRRPVGDTILGDLRTAGRGVSVAGEHLDRTGARRPGIREYASAGLHSLLAVPLICDGRIIGAMSLGLTRVNGYAEQALPLAENVAGQIAGAIARSQLNAKAIQLAEEREIRSHLEAEKRELERVSEAKSEFLSTVSHELKTPLATMLGFADVLARNRSANLTPRQVEQLGLIQRNGRRLGVLINDLVDVSSIDAGRFDIDPTEFDALELLWEVAASFGSLVDSRGQTLHLSLPEAPVWMSADRGRLAQVMTNLLSNASKYSSAGSRIEFEAEVDGRQLVVWVRDHGVGISVADQRRLFTSFFRAKNEATRSAPGTGLGLVISKRIIDLHGGSISFESSEGRGTTMRLQVPGVIEHSPAEPGPSPESERSDAARVAAPPLPLDEILVR